jgi:hypothetical protein
LGESRRWPAPMADLPAHYPACLAAVFRLVDCRPMCTPHPPPTPTPPRNRTSASACCCSIGGTAQPRMPFRRRCARQAWIEAWAGPTLAWSMQATPADCPRHNAAAQFPPSYLMQPSCKRGHLARALLFSPCARQTSHAPPGPARASPPRPLHSRQGVKTSPGRMHGSRCVSPASPPVISPFANSVVPASSSLPGSSCPGARSVGSVASAAVTCGGSGASGATPGSSGGLGACSPSGSGAGSLGGSCRKRAPPAPACLHPSALASNRTRVT